MLFRSVSTVVWSIPEFEDINETFLLILKYDLSTKTATFYINPKIGDTEPVSAAALDATVGTARTYISRICFKTHNTAEYKSYMGGARLSTSWTDAVERAKLTVPIVESASGINSTGFTAHWTSVVNATGYKVVVYQDATIVETFDVSGQATESFEITGLNSETEYTYKVYAVDNSGLYSDSSMSAPSLPVTTGILSALNNITASKLIISGKSIITPEEGIIEVYNTQGLQVYKASHIRIVNTGLDTGLYIVKFTNYKGSQFNRKIRIQ